jgi:hypothetical protein
VRVRYDPGGEALCDFTQLRPFSLAPGAIVQGCWGGDNGWYAARVREYDLEKNQATVVYRADGIVEMLPMSRIRLGPPKPRTKLAPIQWVPLPVLDLLLKLSAGGLIGFLLARLLGA